MKRALSLFLVATCAAACGNSVNLIDVLGGPDPVVTPSPTPTPSPTATPGSPGQSDVASLVVLVFGYGCAPGTPEPNHADGVIPAGCSSASLTATPKQANGEDAKNHGSAISWSVAGSPPSGVVVDPDPNNPLFNRIVRVASPRVAATVTLTATLVAPDGRVWTASKVVTVAP